MIQECKYCHSTNVIVTGDPPTFVRQLRCLDCRGSHDLPSGNVTLLEFITASADNAAAIYLRKLPETIEEILTKSTLSLLGLEKDSWNQTRYKIDTTNGRRSVLLGFVEEKATAYAKEKIQPILETALNELATDQQFRQDLATEIRQQVGHEMRHLLAREIHTQLEKLCQDLIHKAIADYHAIDPKPLCSNTDIMDPKSYTGKLGEALLEHIVHGMMSEENKEKTR